MLKDPDRIVTLLTESLEALKGADRRHYGGDWEDWPNGSTGVPGPMVYCLWSDSERDQPEYVGESVSFGRRLWQHFASRGWDPAPTHVSYVSRTEFRDAVLRILFERFAIATLRPGQNSKER